MSLVNKKGAVAEAITAMVSSLLIITFSVVLFLYWFRYTCLLILKTKTSRDYARQVALANHLNFLEVSSGLVTDADAGQLAVIHASLSRDYRVLSYLLEHATSFPFKGRSLEQRMLMIDFKLMQLYYALTRKFASSQARLALEEMSYILSHFANVMGERSAALSKVA
jgi:hypothetical protein